MPSSTTASPARLTGAPVDEAVELEIAALPVAADEIAKRAAAALDRIGQRLANHPRQPLAAREANAAFIGLETGQGPVIVDGSAAAAFRVENSVGAVPMLFRNLASMDVEESIRGNPLDGVVLLCGCDKTTSPNSSSVSRRRPCCST